jgi:hypothetical protein
MTADARQVSTTTLIAVQQERIAQLEHELVIERAIVRDQDARHEAMVEEVAQLRVAFDQLSESVGQTVASDQADLHPGN